MWFSAKRCGTGSWWHGNGCARVFVAAASDGRMRIRGVTDTIIITISIWRRVTARARVVGLKACVVLKGQAAVDLCMGKQVESLHGVVP